ncbi:MAG: carbamoyl-phosphate synthase large subunit, partial [Pseudomonadota bacterium]
TLDELRNDITGGRTPASFEPTIDYVVTKMPRFTFEKFPGADARLTTSMKSVGEVMSIGRTFQESLQKALRGLETGLTGFDRQLPLGLSEETCREMVEEQVRTPSANRLLWVAEAFRLGLSIDVVHQLSGIDPWFLGQILDLIRVESGIRALGEGVFRPANLRELKRRGFSDERIAELSGHSSKKIRESRLESGVVPVYKRVDTCAAEFATDTAYMYSTYEQYCEADVSDRKKIMILGGGPNRIGQGIEFDYCCVHASLALREAGYDTIMVNCNPETVSTDFDTSDRLYFEPLTFEDVMNIVELEKPVGLIVQFGGQTPLKLANALSEAGAPVIGTSADSIDLAEDRERFQKIINELELLQPPNATARDETEALARAGEVGYPLVVRPSYVLGGRAMEIVYTDAELKHYMRRSEDVTEGAPVLLDGFLDQAVEVDVDIVADGEQVLVGGIMQHIEQAGVHSGDSGCVLPPVSLSDEVQAKLVAQVTELAQALNVVGLMNTQFAIRGDEIFLLEVNPRASRTVPFVSKATGVPLAKIAARVMAGETLAELGFTEQVIPAFFSVKESVFPFKKFPHSDPILGPEMKSTGEVMGTGRTFGEAYAKAQLASGVVLPRGGTAIVSVRDRDKEDAIELANMLIELGFDIVATHGTAKALAEAGVACRRANKVSEGRPHLVDMIKNDEVELIINTTEGKKAIRDSQTIRGEAVARGVTYYTTLAAARATCDAMQHIADDEVNCLQDLHETQAA